MRLVDLARRAIACKGWRWMPGMRWFTDEDHGRLDDYQPEYMKRPTGALPDLSDAATVGCLLALVRKAWGDDRAYLCDFEGYDSVEWGVVSKVWDEKRNEEGPKAWFSCLLGDGKTEAEALVAALEKAP